MHTVGAAQNFGSIFNNNAPLIASSLLVPANFILLVAGYNDYGVILDYCSGLNNDAPKGVSTSWNLWVWPDLEKSVFEGVIKALDMRPSWVTSLQGTVQEGEATWRWSSHNQQDAGSKGWGVVLSLTSVFETLFQLF